MFGCGPVRSPRIDQRVRGRHHARQSRRRDAPPATTEDNNLAVDTDLPGSCTIRHDARYAWTFPGGGGAGVSIIDCEWGWRFDHEDLVTTQGGVVIGTAGTDTDHGAQPVAGSGHQPELRNGVSGREILPVGGHG